MAVRILHQADVEAVVDTRVGASHIPATSTTAALAAIGNAINTTGKAPGKMVFNTTTGLPCWAVDGTAGGLWKSAAGATAHTPV